ncbi:hypothetical protein [uncultured Brevundimonas sp.]|uniref:hypothetical protein n=1 Tax=uncultured Brevundimonas sp. TaxID=213418 RepID=UPI0025FAA3BB|nr:hypothetical protein [uncultured Brevundimonas sp.]
MCYQNDSSGFALEASLKGGHGLSGEHWSSKLLKTAWDLFRGSARYKFSTTLVRLGAGMVVGPPILVAVATRVLDVTLGSDWVDDALSIGSFVVGIILIGGGVWFFLSKPEGAAPLPNAATYAPSPDETFEDLARMFADARKKTPVFEGFSKADLTRRLEPGTVLAGSGIQLIRSLGAKTQNSSTFPSYEVVEEEAVVTIRKIS